MRMQEIGSDGSKHGKTYRDLLRGVLPDDIVSRLPRSFDLVGDIALIKLPEDLIPYGPQVSEAIMKIHRNVRSVYARRRVSGVFRIHELIHIGGVDISETVYTENGVRFYVDVKKMFVNPRMATERLRIAGIIDEGSSVLDLFSGYGGFSLNIARLKNAYVVAVDLNSHAMEALKRSIGMNKLKGVVDPICGEALTIMKGLREDFFDVIILDNPTEVLKYVDAGMRLLKRGGRAFIYTLSEDESILRKRLSELEIDVIECFSVREYSPDLSIFRCNAIKR
ncbi:MAG: methyltransferase domain-containing protein [Sulfolobales archaeon]